MKKILLNTVLVTILFLTLSGCSSDSDSSCTPIACLNGGVSNSNCGCDCPQGYTGNNCSLEITPTKITITKIRVKQFPNSASGVDDLGTNPDLFLSLDKSSTNVYVSDSYYPDANGNGSAAYDFIMPSGIFSTSISTIFALSFWDYDDNSDNDLMNTIFFSPYTSTVNLKFPSSFNIQDSNGQYKAEVFVTYEW